METLVGGSDYSGRKEKDWREAHFQEYLKEEFGIQFEW